MKNKKLLSVLVSAVLLCACIAGVLMMGTSAEATTTTYEAGTGKTYATIKDALHAAADVAKNEGWASDAELVIKLTGTDNSAIVTAKNKLEGESTKLFFGQTTIFRADGTKLPITIKGSDNADPYANKINFAPGSYSKNVTYWAFANDYTFENLFIPFGEIGGTGGQFTHIFAGSGNVVFQNVEFLPEGQAWATTVGSHAMKLYGDNFTMDAFAGWEEGVNFKAGELIQTSITLGEGTEYGAITESGKIGHATRAYNLMMAVGYDVDFEPDVSSATTPAEKVEAAREAAKTIPYQAGELATTCEVQPIETKAAFILDAGTAAHNGTSWNNASLDYGTIRARTGRSPVSEALVNLKSGRVFALSTTPNDSTIQTRKYTGDIEITVESGTVSNSTSNGDGYSINFFRGETLYGDLTVNIGGETETSTLVTSIFSTLGAYYDSVVYGTYTFNMTGGTLGLARNVSAGFAGTQNFGVAARQGTITNITGGKINGNYYATYLGKNTSGTIPASKIPAEYKKYIDGSVDIFNFIGPDADVQTFAGGHYLFRTGHFDKAGNDGPVDIGNIVTVLDRNSVTNYIVGNYCGERAAREKYDYNFGDLTTIILDGTFDSDYYGGISEGKARNITNVIKAGTFNGKFFGGAASGELGNIKNYIEGGTFNQVAMMGSASGNVGNVTNTISGSPVFVDSDTATPNTPVYYGGTSGKDSVTGDIVNNISGGTFQDIAFMGVDTGKTGNITNTLSNVTFNGHYYGASSNGTVNGNVTNTFSDGFKSTGKGNVYCGGGFGGAKFVLDGDVENHIEGGTFGLIYCGNRWGSMKNVSTYVTAGTFNGTFVAGSAEGTSGDIYNEIGAVQLQSYIVFQGASCGSITNKINGTKFAAQAFMASYTNTTLIDGNITNEFNGEVYVDSNIICGPAHAEAAKTVTTDVTGNITNVFNVKALASGNNCGAAVYCFGRGNNGTVSGTATNTYTSGKFGTIVCGNGGKNGIIHAVVNNFKGATFSHFDFRALEIGSITNNIYATISVNNPFYGAMGTNPGDYMGTVGDVTNNIYEGATLPNQFYGGGNGKVTITGTITNTIYGGTFKNLTFLGSGAGTVHNIVNTIKGGNFEGHVYGGSLKGTVDGDITNDISGTPNLNNKIFYGGGGDSSNSITITGSIENTVDLAEGAHLPSFRGGCRNGSTGDITNKLISGNFNGINTANQLGNAGAITNEIGAITGTSFNGANNTVASIKNVFDGATFTDHVYAGGVGGTVTGNVTNEVKGTCKFTANFFGGCGAYGSPSTIKGNVTTTVNLVPLEEGENIKRFYGGGRLGAIEGKITNKINSGTIGAFSAASYYENEDPYGGAETTIKGASFTSTLRPGRDGVSKATADVVLTIDLSEGGVVEVADLAKAYDASAETINIIGGEGKLVIGAKTNIVADSVSGIVNVEMTEAPAKGKVYMTVPGNVKGNLNVTASEGVATPFVVVADGNTYVRGTGEALNAQLEIADKISVKVLFPVDFVGTFSYSFAGGSFAGSETDFALTNVFGKDYLALTLPALGLTQLETEFTFNADGYEESTFSIITLAKAAEKAWAANETTAIWVPVAQSLQNLNAVYNHDAENTMTPDLNIVGTPSTEAGSLKADVKSLGAAPVMKNGAAGIKFTLGLNTEAPAKEDFVVKVGDVDVTNLCEVKTEGDKVTIEIYFSAANGCDNVNIKFMKRTSEGNAKYLHINTSVAQIAAMSATRNNNKNAAALVSFLQAVDAANN